MDWSDETLKCDGCGVEISWGPIVRDSHLFCCVDCAQGLICLCGERMDLDDDDRRSRPEGVSWSGHA